MVNVFLDKRKGRNTMITEVTSDEFDHPRRGHVKVLKLKMIDEEGRIFQATQVWTRDKKVRGLFFNGDSVQDSQPLGQLLDYLNVRSIEELIGRRVYLYPTPDNYLLPITFNPALIEN